VVNQQFTDVAMISEDAFPKADRGIVREWFSVMRGIYRDDAFMAMANFVRGNALMSRYQVLTGEDIERFKESLTTKKRVYADIPRIW